MQTFAFEVKKRLHDIDDEQQINISLTFVELRKGKK